MTSKGRQNPLSTLDPSELEAQRIACAQLVKGCERALYHFGLIAGETPSPEAAHIDERAVDIMQNVLNSWRDTLSSLPIARAAPRDHAATESFLMMQPAQPRNLIKRRTM